MSIKGSDSLAFARRLVYLDVALCVAYLGYLIAFPGGDRITQIFSAVLVLIPAIACGLRAIGSKVDRGAWAVIGAGLFAWFCGEVCWAVYELTGVTPPNPSIADACYLIFYPSIAIGLLMILRRRFEDAPGRIWLQGLIAGFAIAALDAAVVYDVVSETATGDSLAIATSLAFPLADLTLIFVVVGAWAMIGRRVGRSWNLLAAAIVLMTVADSVYLVEVATGGYNAGTWTDVLWPAAMLVMAIGAARIDRRIIETAFDRRWMMVPTGVFAFLSIGVLAFDHFSRVGTLALVFSIVAAALTVVQMGLAFRENVRLLENSRFEVMTDPVTGLANRRALFSDLARTAEVATHEQPSALILFNLDGFKRYNDKFGHAAGDVLLRRLGEKLQVAVNGVGEAYRLGGDEFCVVADVPAHSADHVALVAASVLVEHGDGFEVSSSYGTALLPIETRDVKRALKIADQRLYAHKFREHSMSPSDGEGLIRMLQATSLSLDTRAAEASELARATAAALGMPPTEVEDTVRALELRNVGNCAVPEAILNKTGRLTDAEWALVRTHPLVGERILNAVPDLQPVGDIVRHHHERVDGNGYPDGLTGSSIPLGSRIVAVIASYDSMISRRPFRAPLDRRSALDRLRDASNSQFDEHVVAIFCRIVLDQIDQLEARGTRFVRVGGPRRGHDGSTIVGDMPALHLRDA